jgi:hypothetical protein
LKKDVAACQERGIRDLRMHEDKVVSAKGEYPDPDRKVGKTKLRLAGSA